MYTSIFFFIDDMYIYFCNFPILLSDQHIFEEYTFPFFVFDVHYSILDLIYLNLKKKNENVPTKNK